VRVVRRRARDSDEGRFERDNWTRARLMRCVLTKVFHPSPGFNT
jgi:hypothetical protein